MTPRTHDGPPDRAPWLRRFLRDLGCSFLAGVTALLFLFQPFKVEGTSMMPGLRDEERILVNKIVYDFSLVQRGDLIVFRSPLDPGKTFIKRVVGLPGESIAVAGGLVWINGHPLRESYLYHELRGMEPFGPLSVTPQCYFVLGDHRSVSSDSRAWGLVPERNIYGKAVLKYWPPERLALLD